MNLERMTPLLWTLLWLIIGCQSIGAFVEGGREAALTGGDDLQNDQNIIPVMSQQLLNSFHLLIVKALNDMENRMEDKLSQLQNVVNDKISLLDNKTKSRLSQFQNYIIDKLDTLSTNCYRGMAYDAAKRYQRLEVMKDNMLDRDILCDTRTNRGGWIVIQRRTEGDVDFYRNWTEYKSGFGTPPGDFWLGNEAIYELTNKDTYELRIDFNNGTQDLFAVYSSFKLESEADNYRLRLGSHSGTLGEESTEYGLSNHNGMEFSTPDRDYDGYSSGSCAATFHGAWWYNECFRSNLNGRWRDRSREGLSWDTGSVKYYAKSIEMKMRIKCIV